MVALIVEICQTAFQWASLAVIVGVISLRYWNSGQDRRTRATTPLHTDARLRVRGTSRDISWLSLAEPADGGVSQRDPLSALSLSEERCTRRGPRLA